MSEFVSFAPEREFRDDVAAAYEEVGGALRALLPRACLNHVGSTSVPGSLTKGDLDVCVLVSAAAFADADAALASRYARNEGSDRSRRSSPTRTVWTSASNWWWRAARTTCSSRGATC